MRGENMTCQSKEGHFLTDVQRSMMHSPSPFVTVIMRTMTLHASASFLHMLHTGLSCSMLSALSHDSYHMLCQYVCQCPCHPFSVAFASCLPDRYSITASSSCQKIDWSIIVIIIISSSINRLPVRTRSQLGTYRFN